MGQGLLDMFAAGGFAMTRYLMVGLNGPAIWFWMVLAGIGLVWSIFLAGFEVGGIEIVIKQFLCVLLSIMLLAGYKSIDLADYTYQNPGELEREFNTTQGGAPLPTYLAFMMGRFFAVDIRSILSTGRTLSIPDISGEVELLTTDPELLKDSQLKANLVIWNQIVAPYLLRSDPALARELEAGNLLGEFMNPIPNEPDFVGSMSAKAQQVQSLLSRSTASVGDMQCTLSTLIDSAAANVRATSWTSGTGMCNSPDIRMNFASTQLTPATTSAFMSEETRTAFSKGMDLARRMSNAGGQAVEVQSIASFAQMYEKLGRSVLYVAGNRYASDADKLVVLGTKCDKISESSCAIAQSGLFRAARSIPAAHVNKSPEKSGFWNAIGSAFAGVGSFLLTSLFRLAMALLSAVVKSFLPYAMGAAITVTILMSVIGIYLLLLPKRFGVAMEWLLGPIAWANTWIALFGIWIEVDTFLTKLADVITRFLSADMMMARNACSIVVSVGYLVLPFIAWAIIFGSAAKAMQKAGGLASKAVQGGLLMALYGAGKAAQHWPKNPQGERDTPTPGATPTSPDGGQPGGPTAPPSNAPPPQTGRGPAFDHAAPANAATFEKPAYSVPPRVSSSGQTHSAGSEAAGSPSGARVYQLHPTAANAPGSGNTPSSPPPSSPNGSPPNFSFDKT